MNKRVYVIAIVGVVLSSITVAVWSLYRGQPPVHIKNELEVVVDLLPHDNSILKGYVSITFPSGASIDPKNKLDKILGDWGERGQYFTRELIENTLENGMLTYRYELRAIAVRNDVPPIYQDNLEENFCFYTYQFAGPVLVGPENGPWTYVSMWWKLDLGLEDGEEFALTLVLPEGYEPRTDAAQLDQVRNSYMDNEFSIFTTATELTTRFEGGRWRIEAGWTMGEFDQVNTDFYLEVQYRKGAALMPEGTLIVIILVGVTVVALLAALIYLWRLRKRHAGKRQPFLSRHGYVRAVSLWE